MDPNGRKKTRDGRLCGIVGTVLSGVWRLRPAALLLPVRLGGNPIAAAPAAGQLRGRKNRPAWQNNPPGWQKPPPAARQPVHPQRDPQVVTLKRGEGEGREDPDRPVAGWRGNVDRVPAPDAEDLDGLVVGPAEGVKVPGRQTAVTFKVTGRRRTRIWASRPSFQRHDRRRGGSDPRRAGQGGEGTLSACRFAHAAGAA